MGIQSRLIFFLGFFCNTVFAQNDVNADLNRDMQALAERQMQVQQGLLKVSESLLKKDTASESAKDQVLHELKDPEARQKMIEQNASAQKIDLQLDRLVQDLQLSPEAKQRIYQLAAEIFGKLQQESKGDSSKMKKVVEQAMEDPESFAGTWTPEQRQQLKSISQTSRPSAP